LHFVNFFAALIGPDQPWLTTELFLDALDSRLEVTLRV
jgi:hypothetical protein